MSGIAHSLVRRAVDVTQQHYSSPQGDDQIKQIALWGVILLWVTGVLYFATVSAVSKLSVEVDRTCRLTQRFIDLLHLWRCC